MFAFLSICPFSTSLKDLFMSFRIWYVTFLRLYHSPGILCYGDTKKPFIFLVELAQGRKPKGTQRRKYLGHTGCNRSMVPWVGRPNKCFLDNIFRCLLYCFTKNLQGADWAKSLLAVCKQVRYRHIYCQIKRWGKGSRVL